MPSLRDSRHCVSRSVLLGMRIMGDIVDPPRAMALVTVLQQSLGLNPVLVPRWACWAGNGGRGGSKQNLKAKAHLFSGAADSCKTGEAELIHSRG